MGKEIQLNGNNLTLNQVVDVAYYNTPVRISDDAIARVKRSRSYVDKLIHENYRVYGITTGFGHFKDTLVEHHRVEELQSNLIRSHAAGVGVFFSFSEVRAAILIRLNSLIRGYSGVRMELIDKLIELLHKGIYPYVPRQGSVGASGDLAPLSHLGLVLMGEGEVLVGGKRVPTQTVLHRYDYTPFSFSYKEGLALNNGTSFMAAVAALNMRRALNCIHWADNALATSLEALKGTLDAFQEKVHTLRPHPGQIATAQRIRELCHGSQLAGPNNGYSNVQDSYSIRCAPQVHGAVKDVLAYAKKVVEIELNSTTDNPLIFPDDEEAVSAGHFHGEPIALAMDCLAIAISELGNISERRIAKMLDPATNNGLPAFLTPPDGAGFNSGYMIPQYTAASLVAENKVLAHPVSVDSIPTSANQEDHVSFGATAAIKCGKILVHIEEILAIELLCAVQGLDFRKPKKPGVGVEKIYHDVRELVPFCDADRTMYTDMEKIANLVRKINI